MRVLSNFYYVTNIFDLHICDKETAALSFFFEICTDMHFIFFFQHWRNITTSLLMMHLKCTVVHYANLNSSSKNKPFLNYGLLNMLFRFFDFLFLFISIKLLSKNLWNNYHFSIQISNTHLKMYIRMSNLVILKCDTNTEFETVAPFI